MSQAPVSNVEQLVDRVDDLIKQMDMEGVLRYLDACTLEDLREVNRLVVAKIRHKEKEEAYKFEKGNLVSFTISGKKKKGMNGGWKGIVTRTAGRVVEVDASKGHLRVRWKVSPGFLKLEQK